MIEKIKGYIESTDKRTIAFFCNDCNYMHYFTRCPNYIVYTLFGNIVDSINPADFEYFKYCLEIEGYTQFLFVGHFKCGSLQYILKNEDILNSRWLKTRTVLTNFVLNQKGYSESEILKESFRYHIKNQMKEFKETDFFKNRRVKNISVKGVILDDVSNDNLEEICA